MTRYEVDIAGVASVTAASSGVLQDVETSVAEGLSALDSVIGALGSLGGVRSAIDDAADERRRTGPGAVAHGRAVIGAAQRATIAFVEGDDAMSAGVMAQAVDAPWSPFLTGASSSPGVPWAIPGDALPGRGFGPQ